MNIKSMDEVTLIIKAFERPWCLNRLLESIDKYYPDIKIIIADDSKEVKPIIKKNITHLALPFDSGASYGRNMALMAVQTPYVVTLDDDFIFNSNTKLEIWLDILKNSSIDLVGGMVGDNASYEACFDIKDRILRFVQRNKGEEYGYKLYDVVLQFWMAKTVEIKKFGGWDDDFKTIDHSVFFLKALNKIKIAYCSSVGIGHQKTNSNEEYKKFRLGRTDFYCDLILEKFNLEKFIGLHGIRFERSKK